MERCAAFSYLWDSLHLCSNDTSCFVVLRDALLFFDVLRLSALLIRYNTLIYVKIRYVSCNDRVKHVKGANWGILILQGSWCTRWKACACQSESQIRRNLCILTTKDTAPSYKFELFNIGCPGSCSDAQIWNDCVVRHQIITDCIGWPNPAVWRLGKALLYY